MNTVAPTCPACEKGFRKNARTTPCDSCDSAFHLTCTDLTPKSFNDRRKNINSVQWQCELCTNSPFCFSNSFFDTSLPPSIVDSSFIDRVGNPSFNSSILKRITKSIRYRVASELTKIINTCVSINDEDSWQKFFTFAPAVFENPITNNSTKKRLSLSSLIRNRLDLFSRGELVIPVKGPESTKTRDQHGLIKKLVESKIADGNIRGAINILSGDDSLAPFSEEVIQSLRSKHPPAPTDLSLPPVTEDEPIQVSTRMVEKALRKFPHGSAAGTCGISPQHLKDLTSKSCGESGITLLDALKDMINFMLAGNVLKSVCPLLYGAKLVALKKKDGGIRPIAIGNTIRRLAGKVASLLLWKNLGSVLRPVQIGFGTPGGCEAAVHATRNFINNDTGPRILFKVDCKNAFNTIRRDKVLESCSEYTPSLFRFIWQCYSSPSCLFYGSDKIMSESGVQQGDPLGPALFSIATLKLASSLLSPLNVWYLDDGTLGGDAHTVLTDISAFKTLASSYGLELNLSKCEVAILGADSTELANITRLINEIAPESRILKDEELTLLGAPISSEAIAPIIEAKIKTLKVLSGRLKLLDAHDALYLLRNCLSLPKLVYCLRTSPTWLAYDRLEAFDDEVLRVFQEIVNCKLDDTAAKQATLPVSHGGLGIRRATDVAVPAYLSSSNSNEELVSQILSRIQIGGSCGFTEEAITRWINRCKSPIPTVLSSQRVWDTCTMDFDLYNLLSSADEKGTARILAATSSESGAWLHALPVPSLGTKLDSATLKIAVGLRLGTNLCVTHQCVCGALVDESGTHGLSGKFSSGRRSRHSAANETIRRVLVSAGVPAILEPPGLCIEDGKRPDGMTLVNWSNGKPLVWDFSCGDTVAKSNVQLAATGVGRVAERIEMAKVEKYKGLSSSHNFVPVGSETFGSWGSQAKSIIREIGSRIKEVCGDPRSTWFLKQRIALDIVRGNAASVLGTHAHSKDLGEIYYIIK